MPLKILAAISSCLFLIVATSVLFVMNPGSTIMAGIVDLSNTQIFIFLVFTALLLKILARDSFSMLAKGMLFK